MQLVVGINLLSERLDLPEVSLVAILDANHRHAIQVEYNKKHGITPQTIQKAVRDEITRIKKLLPGVKWDR